MAQRMGRCVVAALALAAVGLPQIPARASFHFMVIQEIFVGTSAAPDAQFVELRMTSGGQTQVSGHRITAANADGSGAQDFAVFDHNMANGANGSRILACTQAAQQLLQMTCDATASPVLRLGSGRVTFSTVNSVTYGDGQAAPRSVRGRSLDRTGSGWRYASPSPQNNLGVTGTLPAGDADGDGVADPDDNCPDEPNPVPQADADGDGLGDVCDPTPLPTPTPSPTPSPVPTSTPYPTLTPGPTPTPLVGPFCFSLPYSQAICIPPSLPLGPSPVELGLA